MSARLMSFAEIGAELHCSEDEAFLIYRRAIAKLRKGNRARLRLLFTLMKALEQSRIERAEAICVPSF